MIAFALAVAAAVRVVSLAPALTEDLFAIGAGPSVVGVDAFSNRPPAARRLPRIGAMRSINSEAVAGLAPTLVVGIPYQAPNLRDLARLGVRTQSLAVDTLADDFAAIATLGRLTGHQRDAARLLASLQRRLDAASRATRGLPQPRAFVVFGAGPIYTASAKSYVGDLLRIAHVANVAANIDAAFPNVSAETLEADDPDVLIVEQGVVLPAAPPWSELRAVREHRIVTIQEDDLDRAGPRVADVVDALIRKIAPFRQRTAKSSGGGGSKR
jgi:iron complex transport system substrate-binding protein